MKNFKKTTLLFFALCGCLASCKNNDDHKTVFFPQTLYTTQVSKTSEVMLFTRNKEITNADTIASYIKNVANFNLQNQTVNANNQITFLLKSLAYFENPNIRYNLDASFANRKTEFIFYSLQQYPVIPQDFAHRLLKFKAPVKSVGVAPNQTFTTQGVKVANGSYLDLNFSVLSYKIKKGNTTQLGTIYNEAVDFNNAFLAQLQVTDTIAVQEFTVNYKVK